MKTGARILVLLLALNLTVTVATALLYPSPKSLKRFGDGYLFTFAQITDSQFSETSPIFEKVTSWLAQQQNLSFVVHTGDITNSPFDETAWRNAYRYMHQLDTRCRWVALAGDDDILYGSRADFTNYWKYFKNSSTDQYYILGDKLIVIALGWSNEDGSISLERLEWMDRIIEEHKDLYAVICLHPCLFGYPLLGFVGAPNTAEIMNHISKHQNMLMTLSGHIHENWIRIQSTQKNKVWLISTEALADKGYIRLFDVYKDRIEVYGYSPWTNKTYAGPLDRFTINFHPNSNDADNDLWTDDLDVMPTHVFVPNGPIISVAVTATIITYWIMNKRNVKPHPRKAGASQ